MGATGCTRGSWRCCGRAARPLCVATCAVHDCATRGSISPLVYPQLLATKEITSRHTVGLFTHQETFMIEEHVLQVSLQGYASFKSMSQSSRLDARHATRLRKQGKSCRSLVAQYRHSSPQLSLWWPAHSRLEQGTSRRMSQLAQFCCIRASEERREQWRRG